MHKHIKLEDFYSYTEKNNKMDKEVLHANSNQLSASVDSTSASPQINFLVVVHGRMKNLPRGEPTFWEATGELHAAKQIATLVVAKRLLGGFGGLLSRIFFKW